ncbi:SIP domain-containing protein [Psychrobacter sp. T6-6]|uniref:SIP domain-containing protein n=1 Tax=Psychrobacter sp. T6-6 TaxID=3457452 RepID=UPI003FD5FD5E
MANILLSSERNSYSTDRPYTPLNAPELQDIISHINEEHIDELLGFLQVFTPISTAELNNIEVRLTTVYAEGIDIQVQPKNVEYQSIMAQNQFEQSQTFFIAFADSITHPDELQVQYIALKQKADKKLGKKTIKLTKQVFDVQDSYRVSKNMLRLQLSMPIPSNASKVERAASVPTNEAGYAYLFDLDHNALTQEATADTTDSSEENNLRPARSHCYYTLRKAWQTSTDMQALVDVFLHGDTPGGSWAQSLQSGDTVVTKREFPEKTEHLRDGQALLIADETSMPTVARLLELWKNPKPPLVVCVTQHIADQRYFDAVKMRSSLDGIDNDNSDTDSDCNTESRKDDHFTVLPIVTNQANSGAELATLIDSQLADYLTHKSLQIDKVWGALEANTAKALRPLLKDRLALSRTDVVVKVYWRHD